jgi:HEAT repeat protein
MASKLRWFLPASLLVLLAALGAGWLFFASGNSAPVSPAGAAAAVDSAAAVNAPSEETGAARFTVGVEEKYAISFTQEVGFEGTSATSAPPLRWKIAGNWVSTPVEVTPDAVTLRLQLESPQLEFFQDGRQVAGDAAEAMRLGMSLPLLATLTPAGAVQAAHFDRRVDVLSQGLLRAILASSQVVLAEGASWTTEESDTTGVFAASYERTGGKLEKRKLRYVKVATPNGLVTPPKGARFGLMASATIELGPQSALRSLEARERLEVETGPAMPVGVGTVELSLRRVGTRKVAVAQLNRGELVTVALAASQTLGEDPKARDEQLLKGAKLGELFDTLKALPAGEDRGQAAATMQARLRALFTLEPSAAREALARLHELSAEDAGTVIGALSAANTPEAIDALGRVALDAERPLPLRMDATAGLGTVEKPTREGIAQLEALARDPDEGVRSTALLGLGNTARTLDDAEGKPLVNRLMGELAAAKTPEEKILALKALANSADPAILPLVESALADPSEQLRAAAVEALRLLPGPKADALLLGRLASDPSPAVRRSAILAASFRPLGLLVPGLGQALQREPHDSVRLALVELLGSGLEKEPAAAGPLQWTAANDANAEVKKAAMAYLQREVEMAAQR